MARLLTLVFLAFITPIFSKRPLMGQDAADRLPVAKEAIEAPLKKVVRERSGEVPAPAGTFVNPKVDPGLVCWHSSFAEACEASRKSRKPVLLFQMLGRLDQRFC